MKKPDFFIVGAPKCGTTAMNHYLGQHPEIFMPAVKESHHFATDLLSLDDPYRLKINYLSLFEDAEDGQVVGESSVFYLYSKQAPVNIRRFNDQAKVIAMIRNPVDWINSYHNQLVFNGEEDILDLREALEAEPERKKGNLIPNKLRFIERLFYTDIARFSDQIEKYFNTFGRDSVYVIVYDDFREDVYGVYREVLRYLKVDPNFQTDFGVVNSAKRVRSSALQKIIKQPPAWVYHPVRVFIPRSYRVALKKGLKQKNTIYNPPYAMEPKLRKELQEKFEGEVEKLSDLLGRDLRGWLE